MIIERVFTYERALVRQRASPLLKEREQYLSYMLSEGVSQERIRTIASMLVHVTRLLELTSLRPVELSEIRRGGERWLTDTSHKINQAQGPSTGSFEHTARNWLRYHDVLVAPQRIAKESDVVVQDFHDFMKFTRGLSLQTLRTYGSRVRAFLDWSFDRHDQISSIVLRDVDNFLALKREAGCRLSTIGSFCSALRLFFHWADMRGWNHSKVARGIRSPIVPRGDEAPQGPKWRDVRRLLNAATGMKTADLRAAAIFSLCSIYGIRSGEAVNLTLQDFDWVNETFTVRRVKRGRVQQFPIQFEVGETILRYLQHGRPVCACRNLLVSLRPPYKPVRSATLWSIIAPRMKRLEISSEHFGPHSLRHACATQLLSKGSSLRDIADFLGHRDMTSVSIYAKHDMRSLKQVASFSLAGVR